MAQAGPRAMRTQQRILSAAGAAFADRGVPRHRPGTSPLPPTGPRRPCCVITVKEQLLYLISLEDTSAQRNWCGAVSSSGIRLSNCGP